MTDEQMRTAIAEACGYYLDTEKSDESLWWLCHPSQPDGIGAPKSDKRMCWKYAPNYPQDLNAMHEVEKKLTFAQYHNEYLPQIEVVCGRDRCGVYSATARQRAEAFLRTVGKWRDE